MLNEVVPDEMIKKAEDLIYVCNMDVRIESLAKRSCKALGLQWKIDHDGWITVWPVCYMYDDWNVGRYKSWFCVLIKGWDYCSNIFSGEGDPSTWVNAGVPEKRFEWSTLDELDLKLSVRGF